MKFLILDIVKIGFDGSTTHRIELIENLNKIGQEVHAIVINDGIAKNMQAKGIIVHKIKRGNRFLFFITYTKTLAHLMHKYKFDIIYTRNAPLGLIGMLIWFHKKTKLIYEVNGIAEDEWKLSQDRHNPIKNLWMNSLFYINTFVAKNADGIRAVTENIKNELIHRGVDSKKIFVIGNGANSYLFKPMDKEKTKKELDLDKSIHYVGWVGLLAPWQGVEYLVRSAPLILKKCKNVKFLIVGDGVMKAKLMKMVKDSNLDDKFIFTGWVDYKEVPMYINACDVCVSPEANDYRNSISGGSSLKLFEYLSCGKPVVVGDVDGNKDVVVNSKAGFVVDPRKTREMADAIVKLLNDKKLQGQMGKNGKRAIIEEYSWEHIAKKIVELCENTIKEEDK